MARTKSTTLWPRTEQQAAWVFLRYMLHAGDANEWVNHIGNDFSVQSWLFGRLVPYNPPKIMFDECRAVFRKLQPKFDKRPFYSDVLDHLGDRFGINEAERRIIWLAVLAYKCNAFRNVLGHIVECELSRRSHAARVIARMTGTELADVLPAIGYSGHLVEIGLLHSVHHYTELTDYLNIPHRLFEALTETVSPAKAMELFLQPAPTGTLAAEDFPHLQLDFTHACRYLQSVLHNKARGVNVLLYGMPGTGKTEFAGLIARHVRVPLYVVPEDLSEPNDDNQSRLTAYRMTQALLSPTKSLILFDDVEDGILDWDRSVWRAKTSGKASLNALLESNPVPAIWITNVAWRFDEAHLRRFDMAIGFKPPPRSVRVSMIDKCLHHLPLTSSFKSVLADDRELTPAQIGKIARIVGSVSNDATHANDMEPMAAHIYRAAYKLRFGRDPDPCENAAKSVEFDPDWANSSVPAARIVDMFRDATKLTACFHGLPGTGKTALAEYIAQALDKPLIVKRASDLLRPFLGETEMLLRGMFDEAMDEGGLLLLDEADSFLRDRRGAQRSWEITQVNELLTQLERFRGHFVATTNAFDVLDLASLRRFDLKIRFEPLRPDQRRHMFEAVMKRLGLEPDSTPGHNSLDFTATLNAMSQLTPGDFAVVARRMSLIRSGIDAQSVLDALSEEHQHKQHLGRSVGFLG